MSQLEVRLIGSFAHRAGTALLEVQLDFPVPVRDLLAQVRSRCPALATLLPDGSDEETRGSFMVLVNTEIAHLDTMIGSRDQVTLVTPLEGG